MTDNREEQQSRLDNEVTGEINATGYQDGTLQTGGKLDRMVKEKVFNQFSTFEHFRPNEFYYMLAGAASNPLGMMSLVSQNPCNT